MASFFQKLHGISTAPAPVTTRKIPAPSSRPKQSAGESSARPAIAKQGSQMSGFGTSKAVVSKNGVVSGHVNGSATSHSRLDVPSVRRTQSSATLLTPVAKKRRLSPLSDGLTRTKQDISRVSALATPTDMKRRRTASPAYRIIRSSSDDETDFSEPVPSLFRGDTPDIVHYHPVGRDMLNLRAGEDLDFMHAEELVCVVDKESFVPETEANPALQVIVQLPYAEERFKLLRPKKNDEYHPTGDIVDTVTHLLEHFLPPDTLPADTTRQDYIYRLSKAIKSLTPEHALPLLKPVNDKISTLRPFASRIEDMTAMPRDLLQRICMQCYTRQVSPHLEGLRKYTAFSSTVYGELLFPFLSKIFTSQGLRPRKTFVDLGCGVGNCVIQAAGETGCHAYGIEIMDHAARLATAQIHEFEARMRAWGLSHGPIEFHHGDMIRLDVVPRVLSQADVVLCNNYAFTAELNDSLLRLFLDLPEGARVISLKSFVPVGKDGRARGARGGVGEMLKVEMGRFGAGSVSWMPGGGEYFISTVHRG